MHPPSVAGLVRAKRAMAVSLILINLQRDEGLVRAKRAMAVSGSSLRSAMAFRYRASG